MKILLLWLGGLLLPLWGAEEILRYEVEVTIQEDTALEIVERITVRAEGREIRRGIYRDFPVRYASTSGVDFRVGFKVLEVLRDGRPEPWRLERHDRDQRVYVGDPGILLPAGVTTYQLRYRTSRQLAFLPKADELYFNLIAHAWTFPILEAEARIFLPESFADAEVEMEVWTGPAGAEDRNAVVERSGPREVRLVSTAVLPPQHGITLRLRWPKGLILPLSRADEWRLLLEDEVRDNPFFHIAVFGFLAALAAYLLPWLRHGRDPERGVVIPRFSPPLDVDPGAARFLIRMGYDTRCLAATILGLAAKGWLRIVQTDQRYVLEREAAPGQPLQPAEQAVLEALLKGDSRLEVTQTQHARFTSARKALIRHCEQRFLHSHFHPNTQRLLPGVMVSLATLGLFAWQARRPETLFLMFWLSGWTLGVLALLAAVISSWKNLLTGQGIKNLFPAIFLSLFSLPFLGAEIFVGSMLAAQTSAIGMVLILCLLPLGIAFRYWMKAPTIEGRRLLDEMEGLKLYLGTAEVDRLQGQHPPRMTPARFDEFLPYALALEVEQAWAEAFEQTLGGLGSPGSPTHQPRYLHGTGYGSLSNIGSTLGRGLVSTLASASTSPSSGGSGGGSSGGSSGGGRGGGGGGGW